MSKEIIGASGIAEQEKSRREIKARVLIHSPYPLAGGPNGVDNFIFEISPYLNEDGYLVRRSGPSKGNEKTNADYTLGRSWQIPIFNKTKAEVGLTLPFTTERAEKIILTTGPDLVVMHEPLAGNSAHTLMLAMPRREDGKSFPAVIGHFHSMSEVLDWKTRGGLFLARYFRLPELGKFKLPTGLTPGLMNTVMADLDGRIAVSSATARHWNSIFPGDYEVIPNGIDTKKFIPLGPKIERWLREATDENGNKIGPIVMMAGRHDPRKRMDVGIEAFAEIRKVFPYAKLKITGFGSETEKLKRKVQGLGLDLMDDKGRSIVEFVGILSEEELIRGYRTADLFMALSDGGEGWGRVGVQASACGCALVETNIDGHREAVGGLSFVWLVRPGDSADTARAGIEALKIEKEKRDKMGFESYETVDDKYSWGKVAKQTENVYEDAIKKRGKVKRTLWVQKRKEWKEKKNPSRARKENLIFIR